MSLIENAKTVCPVCRGAGILGNYRLQSQLPSSKDSGFLCSLTNKNIKTNYAFKFGGVTYFIHMIDDIFGHIDYISIPIAKERKDIIDLYSE